MSMLAVNPSSPPGGYDIIMSSSAVMPAEDDDGASFTAQLAEAARGGIAGQGQPTDAQRASLPVSESPPFSAETRSSAVSGSGSIQAVGFSTTAPVGSRPIQGNQTISSPHAQVATSIDPKPDTITDADPPDQDGSPMPAAYRSPAPSDVTKQPGARPPHSTNAHQPDLADVATAPDGLVPQANLPSAITGSSVLLLTVDGKGTQHGTSPGGTGDNLAIAAGPSAASASGSRAGEASSPASGAAGIASDTSAGPAPAMSAVDTASATAASAAMTPHGGSHAHITSPKSDQSSASVPIAPQAAASLSETSTTPISAASLDDVAVPAAVLATVAGQGDTSSATPQVLSASGLPLGSNTAQLEAADAPDRVGASLLTLASSTDGTRQMTVSLHPKELGTVRVQLELAPDGTAKILVAASEPGTLRSLMANQDHLHAALDAASIMAGGRHLSFELEPATAGAVTGPTNPDHPDASGTSSASNSQAGANMSDLDGSSRQDQGGSDNRRASRQSTGPTGSQGDDGDLPFRAARVLTARLLPSGSINITA